MPSIKELKEKRAVVVKQIRAMADLIGNEGRDFTAEERTSWDKAETDCKTLESQITALSRADELDAILAATPSEQTNTDNRNVVAPVMNNILPENEAEDRAMALQAWMLGQAGLPISERHRQACGRCAGNLLDESAISANLRSLRPKIGILGNHQLSIPILGSRHLSRLRQQRTLGDNAMTVTTTGGGYLIPEGFVPTLERAMLAFGSVMSVADVIRTASGNDLPWPTVNDTSSAGETIAINTEVTEGTVTVGQTVLKAYKGDSKAVYVPNELIQDSAFNLEALLADMLGERIGRFLNAEHTTGAGTTTWTGVVTAATAGKTTASATAITANELLDLMHSVDPAYRDPAQNCGWMMSDNVLLYLKKLVDGQGRILLPELRLPSPRLEGFPIYINQQAATSVTHSAVTVLFGAFRKFKVRMVGEIRLMQLRELRAQYDQTVYLAWVRGDSNIVDAGTHPIKKLTQA